jgi:O-antigen/teichoic acid export membrane protein
MEEGLLGERKCLSELQEIDPLNAERSTLDLKDHTIRSTGVTLFAQVLKFAIQMSSVVVLARLLSPSDFGLVSMVAVFTGLLELFKDGGLSVATIQRKRVTHAQVSSLFWINCAVGLALATLCILSAPLVADFYHEPRLAPICRAISATFFIGGLAVQHDAVLRRQMNFRALARIDVLSALFGALSAIAAALIGLGYWSLVVMTFATKLSNTAQLWAACHWRPGWAVRGAGVWPMVKFGLHLVGANLVGYFSSNLAPSLIGFIGGAAQLGLFNRAITLTSIPSSQIIPPIMGVAQPALARVISDPALFRYAALSLLRKVSLLTTFITITLAVFADWIVIIALGPQWDGAIPAFRMLAVFTLVEPVATLAAIMLIAAGRPDAIIKSRFQSLAIIVLASAVGAFWGVTGIIAGFALSGLLLRLPLFLWYVSKYQPVSKADFAATLAPFMALALLLLAVLTALRASFAIESAVVGVAVFLPLSATVYLMIGCCIKPVRLEVVELYKLTLVFWEHRKA